MANFFSAFRRSIPTCCFTLAIVLGFVLRETLKRNVCDKLVVVCSPILHTDLDHLLSNLVWYIMLSIPIILLLPTWTQPMMFAVCSAIGHLAHTIMHTHEYYSEHVEGSSSVVYGTFFVSAYALAKPHNDEMMAICQTRIWPHSNQECGRLICGVMVPVLLIIIATAQLIATASVKNVSQPAHLGGVAGGIIVVSVLVILKKHNSPNSVYSGTDEHDVEPNPAPCVPPQPEEPELVICRNSHINDSFIDNDDGTRTLISTDEHGVEAGSDWMHTIVDLNAENNAAFETD